MKNKKFERIKVINSDDKSLSKLNPTMEGSLAKNKLHEGQKISVASDAMWKVMFLNSKRLKYSCKLISCIIDVEYDELLKNLKLVSSEFDRDNISSKAEHGDYVADFDGNKILIEVNNNYRTGDYEDINLRNLDYLFSKFREKNKRGESYNFTNVILINLHNFYYKEIDSWYDIYTINNGEKDKCLYTEKIRIINFYLPLLLKKCYDKDTKELSELERILLTIYLEDIDKAREFGEEIEIMREYIDEAIKVSNDDNIIEAYDKEAEYNLMWKTYWKEKIENESHEAMKKHEKEILKKGMKEGIEKGIEKGIEQGMEKGMEQGKQLKSTEIAKKLLEENINIDIISKTTGLSKTEIEKLNT